MLIAAAISIPAGIAVARRAGASLAVVNVANVGRTLPSLAVLALVMPLLGTGFTPALFALTLIAVIVILTLLQFMPVLVLGPVADHLSLVAR